MAKTLADMTTEERAECVGMWALVEEINLAVIVEVDETDTCVVVYPEWQSNTAVHLNEMVTPRYDLPRAWTPDGQPLAKETWEYSYQVQNTIGMWEHPTPWAGETGKWWETKEDAEESALAAHEYGYPIRLVCRRVSPLEVIDE